MAEMVVVSVFTFQLISLFKFVLTSVQVILNALLLRLRDPDPSHSLCLLRTDHHSPRQVISWPFHYIIIAVLPLLSSSCVCYFISCVSYLTNFPLFASVPLSWLSLKQLWVFQLIIYEPMIRSVTRVISYELFIPSVDSKSCFKSSQLAFVITVNESIPRLR